jgi:hypothetical protein
MDQSDSADPAIIHSVDNSWSMGYEMFGIAFVPVRAKIEDYFLYYYSELYEFSLPSCSVLIVALISQ